MKKKSTSKATSVEQRRKDRIDSRLAFKVGIPFFLLIIIRIISGFFPDQRLWGLNHFAFLPLWFSILIVTVGFLFCTPILYKSYQSVAEILCGNRNRFVRRIFPFVVAAIAACIFWSLRMQTYFLGDGAVYLGEIYRLTHNQSISQEMLYSTQSAPLTGWIYATLAKQINNSSCAKDKPFDDTRISFWIVGPILGFLFVLFSSMSVNKLSKDAVERLSYIILLLSSAGVIFYFGYVEYYAFVFTLLAFYFLLIIGVIEGKSSIVLPIITLALASAFHLMALIALPSLIIVILHKWSPAKFRKFLQLKFILISIAVIIIACGVYYFASGISSHGSRNIISLFPFGVSETLQSYTLLSSYHLIDFLNLLFLLAAPLIAAGVFLFKKHLIESTEVIISLVNLIFFFCLAFFGYASFGLARDWDINAVLGLAVLFFIISVSRQSQSSAMKNYFFYAISGASICGALAWFGVNIDAHSSVERYKNILALDAAHIPSDGALNGYEHLRKWYFSLQDAEGTVWAIQKKIECVGYPSDYRTMALAVQDVITPDQQRKYYDWMMNQLISQIKKMQTQKIDSLHAGSLYQFAELTVETILQSFYLPLKDGLGERYAKVYSQRIDSLLPGHPLIELVHGAMEWNKNPSSVPKERFLSGAKAIHSSSQLCVFVGRGLLNADEYQAARVVLERGYRIDTTSALPLFYLAVAESQLSNDYQKIERYLERFLADPKIRLSQAGLIDKGMIEFAQNMLQEIRNAQAK